MALTREIIENSSDHLDEVGKLIVISLVRELEQYRKYATLFSGRLIPAIAGVEGTIKARQINGILKEIEKLGIGEVEIRGESKSGLWWSQIRERNALVEQLFTTLFDDALITGNGLDNVVVKAKGNYGIAAVGQRPYYTGIKGRID